MIRAWKKPFDETDVYDLKGDDSSRTLVPLWDKLWQEQSRRAKRNNNIPGILPVIFRAFFWDLVKGGAWQLVSKMNLRTYVIRSDLHSTM